MDYGNATITINGGKVSASGYENAHGIDAGRNVLTLGWTDTDDFIANSRTYSATTVRIKDGQMMTDSEGHYYSGTLTDDELTAIQRKTLYPVPDAHTITAGTVTGGSLAADRNIARYGETVTITTAAGYRIVSAKFNDSDITIADNSGTATFTMPNENVTITAAVEKIPHAITIGTVTGGSVAADKTTAGIDDTVTLTVTPEDSNTLYSLKAAYTDSDSTEHRISVTGSGSTYTFTMPNADVTVTAAFSDGLGYDDGSEGGKTTQSWTWLASGSASLSEGWYSAQESMTISERIVVTGDVKLVLADGVTLTIPKGITVEGDNKLTVYGQSGGTGTLTINNVDSGYAGIGGGGDNHAGGTVTICGGVVNVTGGYVAAAIGGGTAADGGTITITGGKVTATNSNGVGIGGGFVFDASTTAAISLGWTREDDFIQSDSYRGTVTFSRNFLLDGTNTVATTYDIINGAKIVPCTSTVRTVTFDSNGGSEIDAQKIIDGQPAAEPEKPMKQGNKFGGWYSDEGLSGAYGFGTAVTGDFTLYAKWETPEAVSYVNANGETVSNFTDYTPLEESTSYTNLPAGFWYVSGDVTMDARIYVNGEVSIILGRGATLTAEYGISVTGDNTLNVFSDSEGTGRLIATGNYYAAIGSDWSWGDGSTTGTINIYGGQVQATQTDNDSKAIGASYQAMSTGTITLGYTHAEDFIEADSYNGAVSVVSGKTFIADGTEISGSVSELSTIDGKKLTPKGALDVTVTGGVIAPEKAFAGQTVTLTYAGEIPAGYEVVYKVNGTAITGNTFEMPEGGASVGAELQAITYSITYSGIDGAEFEADNPADYTVEDSFTLTNPTMTGYDFAGWTGTGLDGATMTVTIPQGSTGDRIYTATWKKNGFTPHDENTPEFAYHSLILSGQIGVIFHVYVPDGASSSDYCMYFDVSGDKSQNAQPTYPFEAFTEDGHQFFGYKCYINSVQMADEIHARLDYGGQPLTQTYTAKSYLDTLIDDTTQSADVTALGKAIKDYGCYVQPVLADFNGWSIDVKHASMDAETAYTESHFETVSNNTKDYALECTVPQDSGIDSLSFALVLDSETAIEIYLAVKDTYTGNVGAFVDGSDRNMAVKKGGEYVVSIGNISAHLLGEPHSVEVVTGDVSFTFSISAISYVQSAIHDRDPAMKRAVTSLYCYWDATMTYRKNRPNEYKD